MTDETAPKFNNALKIEIGRTFHLTLEYDDTLSGDQSFILQQKLTRMAREIDTLFTEFYDETLAAGKVSQ